METKILTPQGWVTDTRKVNRFSRTEHVYAIQFDGTNGNEVKAFGLSVGETTILWTGRELSLYTRGFVQKHIKRGEFVVKNNGTLSVMSEADFHKTYCVSPE
jgi:hypothetical protein